MARIRHQGSRSHYEHNYRSFGREVLQAEFMQNVMRARAVQIQANAQQMSPVESGDYINSFEVTSGVRATGPRNKRRAFGRVTNTAPHAMAVEFGFGRTPRYRVLGRAAGTVIGGQMRAGA